jgi:DedD protein
MPKAVSEEEIRLRGRARRRLLGAILLVTIAVVVLPMVLDEEPRPVSEDIAIHIPSRDQVTPLPPPPKPGGAEVSKPISGTGAGEPAPAKSEAAPPPEPPPAKAATEAPAKAEDKPESVAKAPETAAPKTSPEGAETKGGFVVQLAAFSDPANAQQKQLKLASEGIKTYTDSVKTQKGQLTRVRVGPFPSREAAEKEQARLAKLGVKGLVAPQ